MKVKTAFNANVGKSNLPVYSKSMTHLEYMQSEASKNWEFHSQNMDNLQRESNTTLTFLYVVISASFSGAFKLFLDEKFTVLALALSCLCIYLAALAICLLFGCMMARPVKAPANEPENLKIQNNFTSDQIQEVELQNLQERIGYNANRNAKTARRLNGVRIAICFSPIIFIGLLAILWALSGLVCRG